MNSLKQFIRNSVARRLAVPDVPIALQRLKERGFAPAHVFDVGAYQGDFAKLCFQLWPQAAVTCFEAQPQPLARLQADLTGKGSFRVISCLLGAEERTDVTLHLAETASSVLVEQAQPLLNTAKFPMRTLDDVVERDFAGQPPALLKLDVQGYELEVLKGSSRSLPQIQVLLAEVNFLDIHAEVPLLADIVAWLKERAWVAYDICSLIRRPLDQTLWQADMIFVPENSPLRSDKRWGA